MKTILSKDCHLKMNNLIDDKLRGQMWVNLSYKLYIDYNL